MMAGDGTMTVLSSPRLTLFGIDEIVTGSDFTCARTGGGVGCWGRLPGTTTDTGATTPVPGVTDAVEIGAGAGFARVRHTGGTVSCWGVNDDHELGISGACPTDTPATTVNGLSDASSLAVGASSSCAIRATGTVVCWGANGAGQLGDGTMASSSTPVTVLGLPP